MLTLSTPIAGGRNKQRVFNVLFVVDADVYVIGALPADPSIARRAFRLRKLTGDREAYDVRITEYGAECECKGFLAHGQCRHGQTLLAASKLFDLKGENS